MGRGGGCERQGSVHTHFTLHTHTHTCTSPCTPCVLLCTHVCTSLHTHTWFTTHTHTLTGLVAQDVPQVLKTVSPLSKGSPGLSGWALNRGSAPKAVSPLPLTWGVPRTMGHAARQRQRGRWLQPGQRQEAHQAGPSREGWEGQGPALPGAAAGAQPHTPRRDSPRCRCRPEKPPGWSSQRASSPAGASPVGGGASEQGAPPQGGATEGGVRAGGPSQGGPPSPGQVTGCRGA